MSFVSSSSETFLCCLCLQPPLVPVEFICFPCPTEKGRPGCHAIQRVCWMCARRFLELDSSHRSFRKRCLYCQATVQAEEVLTEEVSFRFDFRLMSQEKTVRSCPLSENCEFRGTPMELYTHGKNSCAYRWIRCHSPSCQQNYRVHQEQDHARQCASGFEACPALNCSRWISNQNKNYRTDHLRETHGVTACFDCDELVSQTEQDAMSHHLERTCPKRMVKCEICQKHVMRGDLVRHYQKDLELARSRRQTLETRIHTMQKEIKVLDHEIQQLTKKEFLHDKNYSLLLFYYSSFSSSSLTKEIMTVRVTRPREDLILLHTPRSITLTPDDVARDQFVLFPDGVLGYPMVQNNLLVARSYSRYIPSWTPMFTS